MDSYSRPQLVRDQGIYVVVVVLRITQARKKNEFSGPRTTTKQLTLHFQLNFQKTTQMKWITFLIWVILIIEYPKWVEMKQNEMIHIVNSN